MSSLITSYRKITESDQSTIDSIHNRMHRGEFFSATYVALDLGTDDSIDLLIVVPIVGHARLQGAAGGESRRTLYKNTTVSNNGNELDFVNRNTFSSKETSNTIFVAPTITNEGVIVSDQISPGGERAQSIGSDFGTFGETILSPGNYLLRITNIANGDKFVSLAVDMYEPGASAP